jgi:hypothetical protein
MSKITRITQLIFGSTAGANQMGVFGSLAAGTPTFATNVGTGSNGVQNLGNYLSGWFAAILGANSPSIQDMNGLFWLVTYQLAYMMQEGVPEWDSATTYYTGSLVSSGGALYISKVDTNLNHAVTSTAYWISLSNQLAFNPQVTQNLAARAVGTWTTESAAEADQWLTICWSPELALFCALSNSGTNRVQVSPDGKAWTSHDLAFNTSITSICWSPELGVFACVALNPSLTAHIFQTSPDGTTWTSFSSPSAENWNSICWAPEIGTFVSCAETGGAGTYQFAYSTDGVTFTGAALAGGESWAGVCWSSELNLFVSVATAGTTRVATSSNGTLWAIASGAVPSKAWEAVCWSKQLGLFCAVSTDGFVMTSPDGQNWTLQSIPEANAWQSVVWAQELGLFVAVASSGTHRVMFSFDGVNWSTATAAEANTWSGVAWSPSLGIFAAVAQSGTHRVEISKYVKKLVGY